MTAKLTPYLIAYWIKGKQQNGCQAYSIPRYLLTP